MSNVIKFILCFSLLSFTLPLKASFAIDNVDLSISCDNVTPVVGEEFNIYLNVNSNNKINISSFRLKFNFDNTKVYYKDFYSDINMDDFKSNLQDNELTLLYVTSENGTDIAANSSQTLVELNFKVLSSAKISNTTISASIDGLCNYNAQEISSSDINPIDITISQSGTGNCDLLRLNTDGYNLSPAFSSDIVNYSLDVPYSKSTIEFNAEPVDQDSTVKVNRKTLKTPGTSTDITITVISADKKSRKIYKVTVNRCTKEESKIKKLINTNDDEKLDTDETLSSTDTSNFSQSIDSSANQATPLIVKENSFNPVIFIIVSTFCVILCIFILKNKKVNRS